MLDSQDPIWYNRMPTFDQDDIQKTNYLYCKMAHSGRDQWTEATPSSVASVDSAPSSGNPGSSQKQCRKCFCLPNTQRIGCVKISCSESPASPNGKMPAPPAQLRKRSQVLVPHSSRSKGSVKAVEDGRLRMRSNAGGSRFPPVPQNPRYK
ncbi:hypothetical protein GGI12_004576 [Dipsacomyces acuminosporus]|nr:hypothetical protein GGI12_004576 [Dipsacomyces acuminosporus]